MDANATENTDEPIQERLEGLIRIEAKATEAAEAAEAAGAAATAAAATAAGEAKAAEAARKAEAAGPDTELIAPPPKRRTAPRRERNRVLELRLTDGELEQIERLATETGVSASVLARTVLLRSLGSSEDG